MDESVWAALETLPNATIPRGNVKPIRRLTGVAACLAADGLVPGAVDEAHRRLHKVLDGRAVQHDSDVTKARADVLTMAGEEVRRRLGANGGVDYASFSVSADPRAIEDSYRNAVRLLSPALCSSYVDHIARPDEDGEDDLLEAHITTASLALVPEIVAGVEQEAEALAREWLTKTRVARKGLTDERQAEYDRWEGMSTQPERTAFLTPVEWQADSRYQVGDDEPVDLPTWEHHIMVSVQGTYPALLNEWERKVLVSEMNQPGFKAWYRNPPRASKDSLAVPYKDSATGSWKPMRPDFVFFGTNHDGSVAVDLVDPHGHYLSDALPKLRGLADYAETYEAEFRRIESVAQTDGTMRVLDLTQPHVRQAIRDAADAKRLYLSDAARDY